MKHSRKSYIFSGLLGITLATVVLPFSGCNAADNSNKQAAVTINDIIVTEDEIRDAAADELESIELRKLREAAAYARDEREAMIKAMERLLEEKLLALEAAEQNISKEQLVEREILRKITDPTEEEIDRVYELNKARVNRPKEDVADSIKRFLRDMKEKEIRDEFMRQLEQKNKVARNLESFRFDVKTAGHPSLGPEAAPVKLALFSDFECPYCRDFKDTLMEITEKYGGKVQLVFFQFPLNAIHQNAQRAAEASLCARDQNRFWEMHDMLFDNQRSLTEENILRLAASLDGFDSEKFRECLSSGRHKTEVLQDIRAAAAAGADSTPTLFINGIYLSGGQPYDAVATIIDKELKER